MTISFRMEQAKLCLNKKQRYLTAAYHSVLPKISERYEVWAALRARSSSLTSFDYSGHSSNADDSDDLWAAKTFGPF